MSLVRLALAALIGLNLSPAYADHDSGRGEDHEYRQQARYDEGERHDHGRHGGHDNPHNPHYRGYSGRDWDADYGVRHGHCDSEAAGAAVGAAIGGVIGSQAGQGGDRRVATIVGVAVGAVLGAKIAHDIDRRDAACIGHSLELARDGERVAWERDRHHYEVRPINRFNRGSYVCRTYDLVTDGRVLRQTACQSGPGVWNAR